MASLFGNLLGTKTTTTPFSFSNLLSKKKTTTPQIDTSKLFTGFTPEQTARGKELLAGARIPSVSGQVSIPLTSGQRQLATTPKPALPAPVAPRPTPQRPTAPVISEVRPPVTPAAFSPTPSPITTPVTQRATEVTKSPRDKLVDILLERAATPFNLEETYRTMREEAGIPALEKQKQEFVTQISDVQGLLDKLEKDVEQRTAPFLMTESQRRRQEAVEREPLSRELEIAGRGLATTQAALEPKEQFIKDILGLKRDTSKDQLESITKLVELGDKQTELELKARGVDVDELRASIELMKAPTAEETALGLDKIRAEINKLNAEAAKATAGAKPGGKVSAQVEKKLIETAGVENLLNQLETMVSPLVFSGGPISRFTGLFRRGTAIAGTDPQAKVYNDFRQGVIGQVARAISQEVGVLTDRDIARADKLLPKITDTAEEVTLKMQTIRDLIAANKRNLQATAMSGAASLAESAGVVRVQSPEGDIYEYDIDDPELEDALDNGFQMI